MQPTPSSAVRRRARGAPQRGPVETSATPTRPRKGAPLRWRQHPCPPQLQVQPPPSAPAPPSKQPLSVRPVPARTPRRASPSPQAP
ncbi:hypothetical protein NDU88_006833 [Pleurodeles waltl]|uniref:Uncharacterized protein n=1 Tax=Pleurodeles waltl TaxID=8319 RepID=A0AAV7LQ96_PLEWA|nr:hypothetical protein NDU88_006833 [Pleurodeles waltl]